ncbi:MAG: FAD-dependent oxidoreductase [Candidatus Eremiobacterota bacterium]
MTRRSLLKLILASLAVPPLPARAADRRALVIGAGMAGVAAASRLAAAGVKTTVLEGRDRIGGRIWTNRALGFPLDLGAMWIEGTHGNPLVDLAAKYRVRTVEDTDRWLAADHDGRRLDAALEDQVEARVASLQRRLEELDPDADLSWAQAVSRVLDGKERKDPFLQRVVSSFVAGIETTSSAAADDLSFAWGASDEGFEGDDLLMPDGYGAIVDGLASGLDIRRGHLVERMEHSSEGVRVSVTGRGTFEADLAVVTLPLGVLRAGGVSFHPDLPADKKAALQRLRMGVLDKVVLKFPRATWPAVDKFSYLSKVPGEFPEFLNWNRFAAKPVLIGFMAARFAREMEALPDDKVVARAMAVLRRIVGKLPDPEAHLIWRWGRDPFARGSYSYVPVGSTLSDYDLMARPVGRLLFAGEATSRQHFASVNGAYLSGLREADRALSILRR